MTTAQESLSIGITSLFRFTRDQLYHLQGLRQRSQTNRSRRSSKSGKRISTAQLTGHPLNLEAPDSFRDALEKVGTFSPYSVILGRCDDDLPLLLELSNPAPGSILITGDAGCGKTNLIQSIIKSAVLLNSAERVQFSVITTNLEQYKVLSKFHNCQSVHAVESDESLELIETFAFDADRRRREGVIDPCTMLIIDDLSTLSLRLNFVQTALLFRLIKHGPRSGIWSIALLPSDHAGGVHGKVLAAFRTRLIGKIASTILATSLTGEEFSPVTDLESGIQFCVPVKGEWVLFRNFD